ncbi:hypothetical protein PanWU01x14_210360, partial [Parasponia andersonii]
AAELGTISKNAIKRVVVTPRHLILSTIEFGCNPLTFNNLLSVTMSGVCMDRTGEGKLCFHPVVEVVAQKLKQQHLGSQSWFLPSSTSKNFQ